MSSYTESTKRIAKNTIVLYLRMVVVMIVALYTSRIVLNALGVEDFGLYNVIGGVVGLFSFFRTFNTHSEQMRVQFDIILYCPPLFKLKSLKKVCLFS